MPVSYTHLDVYKRQVQNLRFGIDPQTAHRMMNRRRIGSRIVWRIIQPHTPGRPAEFILFSIDRFAGILSLIHI